MTPEMACERLGCSQLDLSRMTGVHANTMGRWVRDGAPVTARRFFAVVVQLRTVEERLFRLVREVLKSAPSPIDAATGGTEENRRIADALVAESRKGDGQ